MRVHNRLAELRRNRGISAAALASQVGVQRQTIYAIEAQRYIPNTVVALRLAQALEVSVEQLFSMDPVSAAPGQALAVDLLRTCADTGQPDQPVRVCRIGSKMIGVPSSPVTGEVPPADAIVVGCGRRGQTLVRPIPVEEEPGDRLVVAGCDPAMPVLSRFVLKSGRVDMITAGCSSTQALTWLKERRVHIGGTHLRDETAGGANLNVVHELFPRGGFRVVTFASWEEGLVLAKSNPRGIREIADLARAGVVLINREVGSGSRFLLDACLKKEGILPGGVCGYEQTAPGHIMAAWHVHTGKADCCVATRAAARVFGLAFIPLVAERYDLVIPAEFWDLSPVKILLESLNRSSFRGELQALGGYDTSETGRVVT